MRYMTSVERFIIRKEREEAFLDGLEIGLKIGLEMGVEMGMRCGRTRALIRVTENRFGPLNPNRREQILNANIEQVDILLNRMINAPSLESIFVADSAY